MKVANAAISGPLSMKGRGGAAQPLIAVWRGRASAGGVEGSQSTRAVWSTVTAGPMLPGTQSARTWKGEIQSWIDQSAG